MGRAGLNQPPDTSLLPLNRLFLGALFLYGEAVERCPRRGSGVGFAAQGFGVQWPLWGTASKAPGYALEGVLGSMANRYHRTDALAVKMTFSAQSHALPSVKQHAPEPQTPNPKPQTPNPKP